MNNSMKGAPSALFGVSGVRRSVLPRGCSPGGSRQPFTDPPYQHTSQGLNPAQSATTRKIWYEFIKVAT